MNHFTRAAVTTALSFLVLLTVHAAAASDSSSAVRAKILRYCIANSGKRVGNGQCAALAVQALKAAGANPRMPQGYPAANDYVWGKQVLLIEGTPNGPHITGALSNVQPGDIAQFSNVKFIKAHYAHHTAIVTDISPKHLALIQQNIGGKKFVFQGAVRLDKLAEGWIRFYEPIPAE